MRKLIDLLCAVAMIAFLAMSYVAAAAVDMSPDGYSASFDIGDLATGKTNGNVISATGQEGTSGHASNIDAGDSASDQTNCNATLTADQEGIGACASNLPGSYQLDDGSSYVKVATYLWDYYSGAGGEPITDIV